MQIYTNLLNSQIHLILKKELSTEGRSYILQSLETIKRFKPLANSLNTTLEFTQEGLKKRQRENINLESLEKILNEILIDKDLEHSLELFRKCLNHVRVMIQHLGDTSNLILDPDLDSYYLVDVVLIKYQDYFEDLEKINKLIYQSLNANKIELKSDFNFMKNDLKFNIFEQIKEGTLYAEISSKTFKDIIKQMTILNQLNQEIARSSKKQSEGLNEMTLPLKQMDEISHLNAQSADKSSQTSQELLIQCAELEAQALRLNTIVHGNPN